MSPGTRPPGPPPLRPFGLVLHHDGRFSHEGEPIRHPGLRRHFENHVAWLPEAGVYVVFLGRFRGMVEVEEAAFFVREVDLRRGTLRLRGGSEEALRPETLALSPRDGALLCRIRPELAPLEGGLLARFDRGPQAELLAAVEEHPGGLVLPIGPPEALRHLPFPELLPLEPLSAAGPVPGRGAGNPGSG